MLESLNSMWNILLIIIGFSVVVFFHELGHFAVAKWAGIRVERFAVGFGAELFGFTYGETRYSFNVLPFGGYVKMLGQEDFNVDKTGEYAFGDDPRSFTNKPVGHRMAVVSAGVVMNLILAAVLFMIVYMVGKKELQPVVGQVVADSPAAQAGLQAGDRIRKINDFDISSFDQVFTAVRLAAPLEPLVFEIDRDGRRMSRRIVPRLSEINVLQVGIAPAFTNEIVWVAPEYLESNKPHPLPGDVVVEVNGHAIDESNENHLWDLLLQRRNQPSTMVVERPDPDHPEAAPQRVRMEVAKQVSFEFNGRSPRDPRDLLGLVPRVRVSEIMPSKAADVAGFMEGDVIVHWGTIADPSPDEIRQSMLDHAGEDIPVRLQRDGAVLSQTFYYRSRVISGRNNKRQPVAGFSLTSTEQDDLVLSGIHAEAFDQATPAAGTGLHKGCRILEINGQAVTRWADAVEILRLQAGQDVTLTYHPAGSDLQQTTTLHVPRCLSTILDLPSYSGPFQRRNFSLNGESEVLVPINEGQRSEYFPAHHPLAIRQFLSEHVGEQVQVTYKDDYGEMVSKSVEVTADMIDPWYRRVMYSVPVIQPSTATYTNRMLNPLKAVWAGAMQTYYFVAKTYLTLQRLIFTRSVGFEHMSGPVGIIRIGVEIAGFSKIEMLYFLALISANLAVLNFLPLPIVDGGLMVFLIIEKIKGSPVSIRTQVITQMIGLVLFATMFVLITFQDISKWVG